MRLPSPNANASSTNCVEQGIEVQGTPRHGGSKDDSAGFSAALNSLINAELAKIVERGR